MFKVIIAGTRTMKDSGLLYRKMEKILANITDDIEIVSGGADGADSIGESYGHYNDHTVKTFLPDWQQYGKAAGPKRNARMASYADACVVFWDGESRGTLSMINEAKKAKIALRVIKY